MLTKATAAEIVKMISDELTGSPLGRPAVLKPKLDAFLDDLAELMRYEELKPSGKAKARASMQKIKRLAGELSGELERPMPELYGALLELIATQKADTRIGREPIEDLQKHLELLQQATSTAMLDVYRSNRPARSFPIVRFLSYRIAVLLDSHFGQGTATGVRGTMFDQVLRIVLKECGISPPHDLANHVMPQALKILRLDQSSLRTSAVTTFIHEEPKTE